MVLEVSEGRFGKSECLGGLRASVQGKWFALWLDMFECLTDGGENGESGSERRTVHGLI